MDEENKNQEIAEEGKKKGKNKEKVDLPEYMRDPIVAEKAVKKELLIKKTAKVLGIFIAVVLLISSIIYAALLNLKPNDVRIKTSTQIPGEHLSVTFDRKTWTTQLDCQGPEKMWDISYNPVYGREHVYTIEEVQRMLIQKGPKIGLYTGDSFVAGMYCVRNDSKKTQYVRASMNLEFNEKKLHEACRVLVATSKRNDSNLDYDYVPPVDENGDEIEMDITEVRELTKEYNLGCEVYAALSYNERLDGSSINRAENRTLEDGLIEYIAYPISTSDGSTTITQCDNTATEEDRMNGFKRTTPFYSDEYVFQKYEKLEPNEYMYVFIEVWFEGSDFDCIDTKLGGYVKFTVDNEIITEGTNAMMTCDILKSKMNDILKLKSLTKEEGKEYGADLLLSDIKFVTLEDKKSLINYLVNSLRDIDYWALDIAEDKKAEADEFLNSCETIYDIAIYLSKYCKLLNYINLI